MIHDDYLGSQLQTTHIYAYFIWDRWEAIKATTCGAIASFLSSPFSSSASLSFATTEHVTATFNKEQSKKIDATPMSIDINT